MALAFSSPLVRTSFLKPIRIETEGCDRRAIFAGKYTRARRTSGLTMLWRPAGLLRDAVLQKEKDLEQVLELLESRPDHPLNLRLAFFSNEPSYTFSRALRRNDGTLAILPVLKRVEFGKNLKLRPIAPLEDIRQECRDLVKAGSDALIVHTHTPHSMITEADLYTLCQDKNIVARSDLIVHPVQIAEAVEIGASAVVIIAAAALGDLVELLNTATAMGIEAVVECHTELELDLAIDAGATIIYLTNFDRSNDKLVPGNAIKLRQNIPGYVVTIAGGGITTARDCWEYLDADFNAVALGKSLLQSRRPRGFCDEIRSQKSHTMDPFAGRFNNPFIDQSISL